jgi:hypothetical protein
LIYSPRLGYWQPFSDLLLFVLPIVLFRIGRQPSLSDH